MIPKASQRGLGQDLATHLLNAQDNEHLEVVDMRGAAARDLHGAFAEWEFQAHALTRCRKYLYSLSLNPDPAQGPLSRAQYLDYIRRVEERLGLAGQPRAVIFHIKGGREHCHVVWSRINPEGRRAVHIAFDREKLMMVTREFAREHGLTLPAGYGRDRDGGDRRRLTLYESHQERTTGLTKEERIAHVTAAWRASDSPQAFVRALEQAGYILATGRRDYVLVDIYGHVNALSRLIDDRAVRTRQIRTFLEKAFSVDSLPTVEEAKVLAAQHRKAIEDFGKAERKAQRLDALRAAQAERRAALEHERGALEERHKAARAALRENQCAARQALKASYRIEMQRIRQERRLRRPIGLTAFLGRVTGVQLVIRKIHKFRDRQRLRAFLRGREELDRLHTRQQRQQQLHHEHQFLDIARRSRALAQVERRELQSLEIAETRAQRVRGRGGREHMPGVSRARQPAGRPVVPGKARDRRRPPLAGDLSREMTAAGRRQIDLTEEFSQAAGTGTGDIGGDGGGDASAPRPGREEPAADGLRRPRHRRRHHRRRGRDDDLDRER